MEYLVSVTDDRHDRLSLVNAKSIIALRLVLVVIKHLLYGLEIPQPNVTDDRTFKIHL